MAKTRHSPAGLRYLRRKKADKEPVYFKIIKRTSARKRFEDAGLTEQDLASLGYKKSQLRRSKKK